MSGSHLEKRAVITAVAETDISPRRLPALLDVAQVDLAPRLDTYRTQYERVVDGDQRSVFLAEPDHWKAVGDRLDLSPTDTAALSRAHEEHLRHVGSKTDRSEEFECALDIRTAVVIDTEAVPKAGVGTDIGAESGALSSF